MQEVKLLPAMLDTYPSVKARANPADTLILTLCVHTCACVCVCAKKFDDRTITLRLSRSGLKVPSHDCICAEKTQNRKKGSGQLLEIKKNKKIAVIS